MYAGSIEEATEALRAIREYGPPAADLFEPMPYAAFQSALDDPPGYRNWWTAEHLTDLHDGAIDAIVTRSKEMPAGPSQLFIVAWGGAVGARAQGRDAAGHPRRGLRRASVRAVGGPGRRRARDLLGARVPGVTCGRGRPAACT